MCGIFAYVNYLQPKKREEIVQVLLQGLQRMEYRGYDSAGIAIDSSNDLNDVHSKVALLRKTGKVSVLEDFIKELPSNSLDMSMVLNVHCGIAHTRWATHGSPKDVNSHPQRSNSDNEFVVVHNGIITNFKEIKEYLTKKGHKFESETDTEVIAKLAQHVHDRNPGVNFRQLVEIVVQQLEGAFALAFKSTNFPGQLVATRRGSPLLVGIKSPGDLRSNNIPVLFSKGEKGRGSMALFLLVKFNDNPEVRGRRLFSSTATHLRDASFTSENQSVLNLSQSMISLTPRCPALDSADNSTTSIRALHSSSAIEEESGIEYFVASDASAIVEHTKQVIFLEDDDVVFVEDGTLSIHRISKHPTDGQANDVQKREVISLNMELQEIMKGSFSTFMQKEIFEQPDSVVNTMRGRVLPSGQVVLGGITDYLPDIKRCRRLILVACGTSYHSAIACRQILEELSELPVVVELASDFLDRQTPVFRDDVCMFVSQSGETADTLMALRRNHVVQALRELPEMIRRVLQLDSQVSSIADQIYKEKSLLVMGRGFNFATCLEGALKIKELSYMHCEGIMSGELKHGPLAMVDEHLKICMVICQDEVYKKSLNALQQVVARSGVPMIIADESVPLSDLAGMKQVLRVPRTVDCLQSILTVIPLQLLAFHIAEKNGFNVDRPRNLAKSVTVE
ncbi:hypothetical protein WR25_03954 [Diploscapter pachys]|uniref:glutamine--fructose-6-phosphate transaminase (isomerizing) n=1 Tax=Diploscapter pachys TaxID=2018661 RepID=A0A2A2KS41_9BILA|nr:hypothetical protein WR25_03954 [Diploscapter pachys]